MFTFVQELFARAVESEFFYGGLALGVLGAGLGVLRALWRLVSDLLTRRWTAIVTVDTRTQAYRHLSLWIQHSGVLAHVRHLRNSPDTGLAPDGGPFWFFHQGHLCRYDREIDMRTRTGQDARPLERITLRLPLARPDIARDWIEQGAQIAAELVWAGPSLHVLRGDWWSELGTLSPRGLETILADDDRIDRLVEDLRWFFASEEWYRQRGVPWRRGYLLHGPPGTGKSSLIRALASDIEAGIASVSLSAPQMTDEDLREGLATAPQGALLVLEDIDAMFSGRQSGDAGAQLSFSGLLNAIDGIGAQEGRALVMTTNHPGQLDPALIRPGRADVHVELGPVRPETATGLFRRFFPGEEALAEAFCAALGDQSVTPAALQSWLLLHASNPAQAATAEGLHAAPTVLAAE
ncbi:MAG: AAA family ATPase [Pseudomonadota bacterium]